MAFARTPFLLCFAAWDDNEDGAADAPPCQGDPDDWSDSDWDAWEDGDCDDDDDDERGRGRGRQASLGAGSWTAPTSALAGLLLLGLAVRRRA